MKADNAGLGDAAQSHHPSPKICIRNASPGSTSEVRVRGLGVHDTFAEVERRRVERRRHLESSLRKLGWSVVDTDELIS